MSLTADELASLAAEDRRYYDREDEAIARAEAEHRRRTRCQRGVCLHHPMDPACSGPDEPDDSDVAEETDR